MTDTKTDTRKPSKADLDYLAQGTAPATRIVPTEFEGEQPPAGHVNDPTSKGHSGSKG